MKTVPRKLYIVNNTPIVANNIHKAIEVFEEVSKEDATEVKTQVFRGDTMYVDVDITAVLSEFTNAELIAELRSRGLVEENEVIDNTDNTDDDEE